MDFSIHAILIFILALLDLLSAEQPTHSASLPENPSAFQLEQRIRNLETEVSNLASPSLRSGIGSLGYRSNTHNTPHATESVQVHFNTPQTIDTIALVPMIWRHSSNKVQGDGFPASFNLSATTPEGNSITLFQAHEKNVDPTSIAPFVATFPKQQVTSITLTATTLTKRAWDGHHIFQLSELLAFSNKKCVSFHSKVVNNTPKNSDGIITGTHLLVDGLLPYIQDSGVGSGSNGANGFATIDQGPHFITFTLPRPHHIDQLIIHPLDTSDTIPQTHLQTTGLPHHMIIEGSLTNDFSTSHKLAEIKNLTPYQIAPSTPIPVTPATCQFIRIKIITPDTDIINSSNQGRVGFSEIRLLSNGKDILTNVPPETTLTLGPERSWSDITDGKNFYGNIISYHTWITQLARRQEIESELPILRASLDQKYKQRADYIQALIWGIVVILILSALFILHINRKRRKEVEKLRLRLAADLHDELGASIHTVGLLSDLATDSADDQEALINIHRRIRSETERCGQATRHCMDMLEAEDLYNDLPKEMLRASNRIMANVSHKLSIKGEDILARLKPRTKADLFLFYKEVLINVSRHSEATDFTSTLIATEKQITLTTEDNGKGFQEHEGYVPNSLKRRTKLLKGHVSADIPTNGGSILTLTLPLNSKNLT